MAGCGLRHLAILPWGWRWLHSPSGWDDSFLEPPSTNPNASVAYFASRDVAQSVRVDEWTGKRVAFFADPNGLSLELNEQ
jgi:hypothetical protein